MFLEPIGPLPERQTTKSPSSKEPPTFNVEARERPENRGGGGRTTPVYVFFRELIEMGSR